MRLLVLHGSGISDLESGGRHSVALKENPYILGNLPSQFSQNSQSHQRLPL